MNSDVKFPTTNTELVEMLGARTEIRFPATFDEFWELLEVAEYDIEYFDQKIIATMSYEAELHSALATQMSHLLKSIYRGNQAFSVRNGNRPICIPDCDSAVFNPDGSVISLPSKQVEYRPGMSAELTPSLVFEVLSKTTRNHDLAEKLPCYKKIPTLRQIIYVDQQKLGVTVWERLEESGKWLETSLEKPEDTILVEGHPISLREIYEDSELLNHLA